MENVDAGFIKTCTLDQLKELADEYGYNVASWQDVPERGQSVPKDIGWIGVDEIEDIHDAENVMEMMAQEAESNSRQFSPNEFWIAAVNEREDSDEAWDIIEEGICNGIHRNISERLVSWERDNEENDQIESYNW